MPEQLPVRAEERLLGFEFQKVRGDDEVPGRRNREKLGHALDDAEHYGVENTQLSGRR